jgi:hypothetical protein
LSDGWFVIEISSAIVGDLWTASGGAASRGSGFSPMSSMTLIFERRSR